MVITARDLDVAAEQPRLDPSVRAEQQAQVLHEIASAAEAFRLVLSRLPKSREVSVALTNLDTAVLWAEDAVRRAA